MLILFCLLFSTFCTGQEYYVNPVVDSNHPDPGVLQLPDGSGFVAVTTSNYASKPDPAFPILFSEDLINWEQRGYVFQGDSWPTWARKDMWAPEIHFVNGRFMVYFSARRDLLLCIGVAISKDPLNPFGPYEDFGEPIIDEFPGVIDIHWFQDPVTEKTYLSYKTDDNAIAQRSRIWLREVQEDGIAFAENSSPTLIMSADLEEDKLVVEGGSLLYRHGYYYLFFSADGYLSPTYHINVARSKTLDGYFSERFPDFLHTDYPRYNAGINCTFVGPGHGTPIKLANGSDFWYVYHTWKFGAVGTEIPGRVMNIDQIQWTSDGWPVIGIPSDTPKLVPNIGNF